MAPKPSKKGALAKPSKAATKPSSPATHSTPNWPLFRPLLPPSDLSLQTLVPSQIVLIHNFWTSTLCKDYVNFLKGLPLATTPGVPKRGDAVRVNDRFQIQDAVFANRLWEETGLRELVCGGGEGEEEGEDGMTREQRGALWGGDVLGLNPNIRIYRYSKGQFFDQHYDESNLLLFPTHPTAPSRSPVPARTTWTLLLYLTSPATGCEGGQTIFYPEETYSGLKSKVKEKVVVELETGMLLLHKHGNECMLHEGAEVTKGEKWVIRSDLCVAR